MKRSQPKARWADQERAAWALPDPMTVSEWADACIMLDPRSAAEPGPWRTSRTPYLREPMDAFADPWCEEITMMMSTQVGKTSSLYNLLGYAVDQDPGPALLVMPRESDAKTVSVNRIQPMISVSPALARHLPARSDDVTALEMRLDRMTVYLAGANSPAALASKPVRYLYMDEVDKFPPYSGREADPIKLATERIRTFRAQGSARVVKVSTPTTRAGFIFREYEKSDQRRYFVPCPHCGNYAPMVFGAMHWPEDASVDDIGQKRLAWLECQVCHGRIEDRDKPRMLSRGVWVPEGAEVEPDGTVTGGPDRPAHRGYWLSALYSPWLSFGEIAAEFLRSKNHPELLQNFVNSWLAEVWEEKSHQTAPEVLKKRAAEYPAGNVPEGALVLTAGVDVQKDCVFFVIRGWGYHESSWLIRWGRVENWDALQAVLFATTYPRAVTGEPVPVRLACVDSGYNAHEVYQFCRDKRERARPIKGQDHLAGSPLRASNIDTFRINGRTITIPGGLQLYHIDTTYFKDKLARLMTSPIGSPTQWWLHDGIEEEYLRQVCAEEKVLERNRRNGKTIEYWKTRAIGGANHLWDAEVYALAAAEMIRVWAMRPADQPVQQYQPQAQPAKRQGGNWMSGFTSQNRGGWMRR